MEGDLLNQVNHIRELVEENNKMLKTIRRHNRIGSFMRLLYWLVILGIGIGSYYYLQPFISPLVSFYKNTGGSEGGSGISDIPKSFENLKNFFDGPEQDKK